MTTGILALLGGGLVGLGLATALFAVAPTHPDLREFLTRVSTTNRRQATAAPANLKEQLGLWLVLHLPLTRLITPPETDLALLRRPVHRFYADKVLFGIAGLSFPALATALLALLGLHLPLAIPLGAALIAGIGMSFLPDHSVRDDARAARAEFRHALSAYVDLVAIARHSGAQTRQAMEMAARTGTNWVFERINEELVNSRFAGRSPWEALHSLADELAITDLSEVANIMRTSGEDSASVYRTLRARAAAIRDDLQSAEVAKANAANERLMMPLGLLFIVFVLALGAPVLLRVIGVAP
ncbi:MAG: type II secretion system F family protein [Actinobacteria bacterium]|nr:type II secretion system F family protein [Actinomycetota bacterium]